MNKVQSHYLDYLKYKKEILLRTLLNRISFFKFKHLPSCGQLLKFNLALQKRLSIIVKFLQIHCYEYSILLFLPFQINHPMLD